MKLPADLLSKAEAEYPKDPEEIREIQRRIREQPAQVLDGRDRFDARRAMIAASAPQDVADAFERYIGTNDLLPINYLLAGYLQSRAVGRIRYRDTREGRTVSATGFLISPELVMTNHHVFPVDDAAGFAAAIEEPTIEFGYEFDLDGKLAQPIVHELDPVAFFHSWKALDVTIVAVKPLDRRGRRQVSELGYLVLNGQIGKAGIGDCATVIQHPEGRDKQIALRNNEIIDLSLPDVIIYKTDTAPGSSGAPVFNNEWQLIALHSAGVPKRNDQGEYVDRDGHVIPVENGKVDPDRIVWLSNRGIRVSAIMRHLASAEGGVALHPKIQALFSPAYTDSRPFAALSRPQPAAEALIANVPVAVPVSVPTTVPPSTPAAPISIQITIGAGGQPVVTTGMAAAAAAPSPAIVARLEQEKFEDDLDFSDCAGFEEEFMNDRIAMPMPNASLRKKLAVLIDSPSLFTLKYHHISTIQHAVRRVPVVSAINVHGKYRYPELGKGTRKDHWFRDNRIDYDAQLDDAWYAKSGFDKGHMSRREDAEWGSSVTAAKAAADMTCSYANAIPQVPALNRAIMGNHGMWGQLEAKLLEQGLELEKGKSARICLFAGPLFADDDPVYKSVQVALRCYKVVVWYDGKGKLRTTCFVLSQKKLVSEIDFEVLRFNEVFKTSQYPLETIEKATGLVFPKILRDTDTGAKLDDVTEESFERLVKSTR
jgi:endonuclease G, mitochondrial